MKLTELNLHKPFTHPKMIGAYCIIDGKHWVHRDNVNDFYDENFITTHCLGYYHCSGLCVEDLLSEEWYNV